MDDSKSEQRVYIKIRTQLGYPSSEIHADLQKVYGKNALSIRTVFEWVRRFKDGRESIENDPKAGRPCSVRTEKNVAIVKSVIDEDARYTVQQLADITGIHSSVVFKILRENLGLRKVCARWVPHLLTDEQKQCRVQLASEIVKKYDKCDPRRLDEVVTGDETWIYNFEPETKSKNKVWIASDGERPIIARRQKTSNRILYAIFFDSTGPVLQIPVPKGRSVTGKFYKENILTPLVDFYQKRRPHTGIRGLKLLHDNAPAHKSVTVREYLKESGLDVLEHPPYSPDLSPCDFWLFPKLKEMLAGRRFESRACIGSAVYQCLERIPKEEYRAAFRKWIDRCKRCVEVDGNYFEGLK